MNDQEPKWERVVYEENYAATDRLAVPGGWLYRVITYGDHNESEYAVSLVFVAEAR